MKKYFIIAILASVVLSCKRQDNNDNTPQLETIKFTAIQSDKAFTGALEIFPCTVNTTNYVGNYIQKDRVSAINPSCIVTQGNITAWAYELLLPLGTYNMIYWGIADTPTYKASRANAPPLRLGTDMAKQSWSLVLNKDKVTYMPVWDQVMAVQNVQIGSSGVEVNLSRKVAGLNVILKNSSGLAFDSSIVSFEVLIGGIAEKLNVVTAEPENQTKTVRFALSIDPTRTTASNVTAMLYPSAPAPEMTVNITLSNGQVKHYTTNLQNAFQANSMQTITILIADILATDPEGSGFTVDSWKESSETIDFPIM